MLALAGLKGLKKSKDNPTEESEESQNLKSPEEAEEDSTEPDEESTDSKNLKKSKGAAQAKPRKRWLLRLLFIVLGMFIVGVIALLIVVMVILSTPLPDITNAAVQMQSSMPSSVYAADGTLLAQWHGDEDRTPLFRDDVPQRMFDATVAIEDRRFFDHSGLDMRGIMRALRRNTRAGEIQEGGSTITQQLMKMMYAGEEQTIWRKVNEAVMATRVEMEYDKRDILTAYLNMAYFGQGAYGLSSASMTYFGVIPAELTIPQAATLTGVLHSPSRYNPYEKAEQLQQRRDLVLEIMLDEALITRKEYQQAVDTPLEISPRTSKNQDALYPYFIDYVQRELPQLIEPGRLAQGGFDIYTTLDPELQKAAETAAAGFNAVEGGPTISMITMRHSDGAILALIGGKNWKENQFNLAVQARRQPGSAFKPVTLIAALEAGISPDQSFSTAPYEVQVKDEMWKVTNYDGSAPSATMTLRSATVASINTVYARLIMEIGPKKTVEMARALGFESEMDPDPALSLGGMKYGVSPLEMVRAYTAMARQGEIIQPKCILAVTDAVDPSTFLYQAPDVPEATRVFSANTGAQVSSILNQVITSGTGRNAQLAGGVAAAGKTGTTQAYRDAWFVGWAQGVTTAVWMGHPEAQISMTDVQGRRVTGGSFPAEIWRNYMNAAIALRSGVGLPLPNASTAPKHPLLIPVPQEMPDY